MNLDMTDLNWSTPIIHAGFRKATAGAQPFAALQSVARGAKVTH